MNTEEAVRQLEEVVRRKHLALATEQAYCAWLRRYCDFLNGLPARTIGFQVRSEPVETAVI